MEHGLDFTLGKTELAGDMLNGFAVPVPTDEDGTLDPRQAAKELVDKRCKLGGLERLVDAILAGNTLLQFIQRK